MKALNVGDRIALIFIIIGGLDWGLIGLFEFDLVQYLFGSMSWLAATVYVLVGISALYMIFVSGKLRKK